MDHIVLQLQPFVLDQEIMIYQKGECIKIVKSTFQKLLENCLELCTAYNINQIDITPNSPYAEHFKGELINNKFNENKINVTIH